MTKLTAKVEGNGSAARSGLPVVVALQPGEWWWGGKVNDGACMPFQSNSYECDLRRDHGGNQAEPLLVSSRGRYIWCDRPFQFTVTPATAAAGAVGEIAVTHAGAEIVLGEAADPPTLAAACRAVSQRFFPASGAMPDVLNFAAPQYNSWIEMQYHPTREKILRYAAEIVENGFAPGVLIIDDGWFEDHGDWRFHPGKFPDPQTMIERLHAMGFRVMLWISPFVSPDGDVYRHLTRKKLLVRGDDGEPAVRRWWNGQSAVLDSTNPEAVAWLDRQLQALMSECGVDGFKFDAGDIDFYRPDDLTYVRSEPADQCEAWARVGLRYRFNEYRACWKLGGQPLVQRLRDKVHEWGRNGLADIVPNGIAQSLLGYSYICPDMVGGGDIGSFNPDYGGGAALDGELFVRTVQCSALFPIVQFSLAPWHVLDDAHLAHCRAAIDVRQKLAPEIVRLAEQCARTGEPILRPLAYNYPGSELEQITDQFLLGPDIMVAPVTERGAKSRRIAFPPGRWRGDDGSEITGPTAELVQADLDRLPHYFKISA